MQVPAHDLNTYNNVASTWNSMRAVGSPMGHEERLPPLKLGARYRFDQPTFA